MDFANSRFIRGELDDASHNDWLTSDQVDEQQKTKQHMVVHHPNRVSQKSSKSRIRVIPVLLSLLVSPVFFLFKSLFLVLWIPVSGSPPKKTARGSRAAVSSALACMALCSLGSEAIDRRKKFPRATRPRHRQLRSLIVHAPYPENQQQ